MFGSFLPNLGRRQTKVYPGPRSRHCYEIMFAYPVLSLRRILLSAYGVARRGSRTEDPEKLRALGHSAARRRSSQLRNEDWNYYRSGAFSMARPRIRLRNPGRTTNQRGFQAILSPGRVR